MAAATHGLMIKYGLASEPTSVQAVAWAGLVRRFIDQGHGKEDAGHMAAKQLFADYRTRVYASEGDTIDTLLRLAEGK